MAKRTLTITDPTTGKVRVDVVSESIVLASSAGLGFGDLRAEVGQCRVFEPEGVTVPAHAVGINLASASLVTEIKGPHGFRRVTFPPMSFWIQPCGEVFSARNLGTSCYGGLNLSPSRAARVLGADMELRPAYALTDERLASIMRLILLEVCAEVPCDPLYIESLEIAFLSRLGQLCASAKPAAGSLGAARLKLVNEYVEDQLAEPLTIEDMAAVAGVSPAHFAREFKRATGETPHAFVVARRLERARRLLVKGGSIADAAAECGFTDQAHLSRLFKRHLGVTPGTFIRRARG